MELKSDKNTSLVTNSISSNRHLYGIEMQVGDILKNVFGSSNRTFMELKLLI